MLRLLTTFALCTLVGVTFADDKKDDEKKTTPAFSGKWVREADGFDLSFSFEKEGKMMLDVKSGENVLTITTTYSVDKENNVTAEITDVKMKGNFPTKPEKGSKFSFKFKVDDKTAKLSDFDIHDGDGAKAIVEGEYKKKTD